MLRLDDGFEVCSFGSSDEYLMIGVKNTLLALLGAFRLVGIFTSGIGSLRVRTSILIAIWVVLRCIFNFGNIVVYIILLGLYMPYTGGKGLVKVRTL